MYEIDEQEVSKENMGYENQGLRTEYLNEILSPELYKEYFGGVNINNDILNCHLCDNVSCKAKRSEIPTVRKPFHFFVDHFTEGLKSDPEIQFIDSLAQWLQLSEDEYSITGTVKCFGGDCNNCSFNLLRELDFYGSQLAVIFSEKLPSFFSGPVNFGEIQYVGETPVLLLPSYEMCLKDQVLYQNITSILWNTVQNFKNS